MRSKLVVATLMSVLCAGQALADGLADRLEGMQATPLGNTEMGEVHAKYLQDMLDFMNLNLVQSDPSTNLLAANAVYVNSGFMQYGVEWDALMDNVIPGALTAMPPLPQPTVPNLPSIYVP